MERWSGDPRVKPPYGAVEVDWGHPLAPSVGCWLLNEGAGSSAFNLSRAPKASIPSTVPWGTGARGLQLTFNAAGVNFLTVADTSDLRLTTRATLTMQVMFNGAVINQALIGKGNLDWFWIIARGGTATLMSVWFGGGYADMTFASDFVAGVWYDLAVVFNGSTYTGYRRTDSGIDIATASDSTAWATSTSNLFIGARGDENLLLNGNVASATISNAALPNPVLAGPYTFLRPIIRRRYFVPAAAGTGTADITLGALTTAATGVLPVAGVAAITFDALTPTATGALAIAGVAPITLGDLTLVASGSEGGGGQQMIRHHHHGV